MSEEYVKTVVITDPSYRAGRVDDAPTPARPAEPEPPVARTPDAASTTGTGDEAGRTPDFDDTSWLT